MLGSSFVRCLKHEHRIACEVKAIKVLRLFKHYLSFADINSDQLSGGEGDKKFLNGRHVHEQNLSPPQKKSLELIINIP